MTFDPAFTQALFAFYTGIHVLNSIEPCVYSGLGIYMSPHFIQRNTVAHWTHDYKQKYAL